MDINKIIEACQRGERKAQNELFSSYGPLFLSICMRYLPSKADAEDILIGGFYKIFLHINKFEHKGSFEGWMKRIIINECLMELRKKKSLSVTLSLDNINEHPRVEWQDNLVYQELLALLTQLPLGYRTVFNMYVIEGYKHKEIGEKLGISINTSKSQLILARRKMATLLKKKQKSETA